MAKFKLCDPQNYPFLKLERLWNLLKSIMQNFYIHTHDNIEIFLLPRNQSINILMNSEYFMTELKVCNPQSYPLLKLEKL